MWTQTSPLLLLLAFSLWSAEAQTRTRRQSIWDDPIKFKTKANDLCTMIITGQGEYTRMRLSCQGSARVYWCEYLGTPHTCGSYNKNPRHYFVQMMWGLRKLQNACQGPKQIKPHMCRKARDDSRMVFSSASFSRPRPRPPASTTQEATTRVTTAESTSTPPTTTPAESTSTPPTTTPAESTSTPPTTTPAESTSMPPTTTPAESYAKRMARKYCWRSLQGICSFFIGLFRK